MEQDQAKYKLKEHKPGSDRAHIFPSETYKRNFHLLGFSLGF